SVFLDHALDGQGACGRRRVADIGEAMLERARSAGDRFEDALGEDRCANGLIAGSKPFCTGKDVGRNTVLLTAIERAGTAHAAHDFIEDEQDAIAVANLAY